MTFDQKGENFVDFFTSYKTSGNQQIQIDLTKYSGIFQTVKTITDDGLIEEEVLTNSYNIFNILKMEKYEDETHTPFLLDLLNIRGSHRQKDLFYRLLIKQIINDENERLKFEPNNPLFFSITSQKGIYTDFGQGFIDILIDYVEPGRKSFSIIIENKIYHSDGIEQLNKYYSFLEKSNRDNILLIYLTLTGKYPDSISMKPNRVNELMNSGTIKLVSYKNDIKSVLSKSLHLIKSDKVKYTILQYQTLIDNILKIPTMEMYKEKLCEFLTNSIENFTYSRQIVDLYQSGEFKDFIKKYYLKDLLHKVEYQINQSVEGWKSQIKDYPEYDEIDLIIYKSDWDGISISWCVYSNEIGICQHGQDFDKEWRKQINEYLRTTNSKDIMREDSPRWLLWESFVFNINDYNTMFKVIPTNSELTSKDLSNQLIRYSMSYENQIREILSRKQV